MPLSVEQSAAIEAQAARVRAIATSQTVRANAITQATNDRPARLPRKSEQARLHAVLVATDSALHRYEDEAEEGFGLYVSLTEIFIQTVDRLDAIKAASELAA